MKKKLNLLHILPILLLGILIVLGSCSSDPPNDQADPPKITKVTLSISCIGGDSLDPDSCLYRFHIDFEEGLPNHSFFSVTEILPDTANCDTICQFSPQFNFSPFDLRHLCNENVLIEDEALIHQAFRPDERCCFVLNGAITTPDTVMQVSFAPMTILHSDTTFCQ